MTSRPEPPEPEGIPTSHSSSVLPGEWRWLTTEPADGGWNMGCDLALLDVARSSALGILRIYGWSRPTVSFGRNESLVGVVDRGRLEASGLDAVRRPTGGRALLHHREVTYAVAMPLDDKIRWGEAYAAVNAVLLRAVRSLGIPAHSGGKQRLVTGDSMDGGASPGPGIGAEQSRSAEVCFSGIAEGEVAVDNRKLVASSVWRERGAYLQHGSLLVSDDQSMLVPALGSNFLPPARAAVLSEWVSDTDSTANATRIVESALQMAFGQCGSALQWSIPDDIVPRIDAKRAHITDPGWLWRR